MMNEESRCRNLTRFTYESTAFQGWRLSLSRNGVGFVLYFSDRCYGGELGAYVAALRVRDEVIEAIDRRGGDPVLVFQHFKDVPLRGHYPVGLRAPKRAPR